VSPRRHAFATEFRLEVADIGVVQNALDHEDVS